MRRLLWVLISLLLAGISHLAAQPATGLSAEAVTILNDINQARRQQNIVPLLPNPLLNEVADAMVKDLASRPISRLGDTLLTTDGKSVDDLLGERDYGRYETIGYFADMFSVIVRGYEPAQLFQYLTEDANKPEREILSRQMIRLGKTILPIGDPLYREIGIAYTQGQGRNYYVIVTGSQPGVLPVIVTQKPNIHIITQTVTSRDVFVWINDEKIERRGSGDIIGGIRFIRVSEQPNVLACPTAPNGDWQRYVNAINWTLSEGLGTKTLYAQLCDERSRTITASVVVNYAANVTQGETLAASATPDVLLIANATQTAAAAATSNAPYLQIVETILTATAAALPPSP